MTSDSLAPTEEQLRRIVSLAHGNDPLGWRPQLRAKHNYFLPEYYYAAVVEQFVTPETRWLEVGGGKSLFPLSARLSRHLADRAAYIAAVDPSPNVLQNPFAHSKTVSTVEAANLSETFDLATLRMVAEHLPDPAAVVESLARLVVPGGHVVIFTPYRWSPVSVASSMIPSSLHHFVTRFFWSTKNEDVFPTHYRMNSRRALLKAFQCRGFREVLFLQPENCQVFHRWQFSTRLELRTRDLLNAIGLRYPETELLTVYRRDLSAC